ncbi:UDP-N-acetylmuramate dehydrogenase [Dehalobacter sp. DCM]|uniref:UDP-N-acetylmuramate dehydrogenase n=1 Tax=Dehalobacter sp. DCM TaxID=2907827 RepID=UPI0030818041|nr:UDP-N-acetylmuramate dehydrogenase [Dehalobacter sp. DCM]
MSKIEKLAALIQMNFADTVVHLNEDMKKHTTFKTGGNADCLIEPGNMPELQQLIGYILKENIPFMVIGQGSNIIVSDKGLRGVVIKLGKRLSRCTVHNEILEAEAGALLTDVAEVAQENGLSGLEFACGIPGSIGGGVFMNAGAYGGEIKNVVHAILVLTREGKFLSREAEDLALGYRTSIMQTNGDIVLGATFKLVKGHKDVIKQTMDELNHKREQSQPLALPSAGSVFKRPAGYYTGKLIEESNLKGYQIGGAQVSTQHAGFIVNVGQASTSDIQALIRHIQYEVKRRFGVNLETEVRFVGEFD